MKDNIRMDSHKLIYHPKVVSDWMNGKEIYPIEIEISPSGTCNHRCIFCAVDYVGYTPAFLDKEIIVSNVSEMSVKGLKSVICSGEGEPLLNKDMPQIANEIKACSVDVAMATNGVLFAEDKLEECLHAFTWVRYSVASFEENSYQEIQRGKAGDLQRVKQNLSKAVEIKNRKQLQTTLGVQCLLLPQNMNQIKDMALELREIGVDYFTIKPYSQHLHSENHLQIDYEQIKGLEEELKKIQTDDFKIYYRANSISKIRKEKTYDKCYGLPFMVHIDAKGNVWPCVAHIGVEKYCYGNIYESSFQKIWEGTKRAEINNHFNTMNLNRECREACRLDEINKYLYDLKHPGNHVNFI